MSSAKKLENVAIPRNLTDNRTIIEKKRRWSAQLHMLERYLKIGDELIEVSRCDDGVIVVVTTKSLKLKAKKHSSILSEIDMVTKSIQNKYYTLAKCREDIDILSSTVEEERNNPDSSLYQCLLGTKYISPNAPIVPHPKFEIGVTKIQREAETELVNSERRAVASLLKSRDSNSGEVLTTDENK